MYGRVKVRTLFPCLDNIRKFPYLRLSSVTVRCYTNYIPMPDWINTVGIHHGESGKGPADPQKALTEDVQIGGEVSKFLRTPAETILVIDDERAIRTLLRTVLEAAGYKVLEARFNSEAVLMAGRHEGPIHLMAIDVMMPGMRGPDFAAKIASKRPEMNVIYMSGNPEVLNGNLLMTETAPFLSKPFHPQAFLKAVRAMLRTDLRRFPRIRVQLPISYSGEGIAGEGTVYDLSRGGCAVESRMALSARTNLRLEAYLPHDTRPLQIESASVCWSTGSKFGLKFAGMPADQLESLERFLFTNSSA